MNYKSGCLILFASRRLRLTRLGDLPFVRPCCTYCPNVSLVDRSVIKFSLAMEWQAVASCTLEYNVHQRASYSTKALGGGDDNKVLPQGHKVA
jgi:hypothetical protein